MGRWTKTPGNPSEQTFELWTYATAVVQNEPDMSEAQQQLQHAKEQLELAGLYHSRDRRNEADWTRGL
jgi:hypothetical protein